jgi:hypothetical protein
MDKKQMEAALAQRQQDILATLYEKYDLEPTDFFEHKHYKIVKREGIEKIMDVENIQFRLSKWFCDEVSCTVHGRFWIPTTITDDGEEIQEREVETLGSSNRGNTASTYFAEMAEKRCLSRGTLKLIKAYRYAFMGEDEIDSRDEEYKRSRASAKGGGAVFKG